MNGRKKPHQSRTLWALAVALAASAAQFYGVDLDLGGLSDRAGVTLADAAELLAICAAGYFRYQAQKRIKK